MTFAPRGLTFGRGSGGRARRRTRQPSDEAEYLAEQVRQLPATGRSPR